VVSAATTGCESKCHRYVTKAKECIAPTKFEKPADTDKEISQCEGELAQHRQQTEATVACADQSSCAQFNACRLDVMKKQDRADMLATVASAMASNEFSGRAMSRCEYGLDLFKGDRQIEDACAAYLDGAIAAGIVAMRATRDAGQIADAECYAVRAMAKKRGSEAKVGELCDEVGANTGIQAALAAAKKNLDGKTAEIPYQCAAAIDTLDKLKSDWAKSQAAKVAKACYADLGQLVLETSVPTMGPACDIVVRKVYNGIKRFNLQNDTNRPLMDRAAKLCDKQ
jgi:hypothetical protein